MPAISEPRNPLGAHIGNGVLFMHFDTPTTGTLKRYEVQVSLNIGGPYYPYSNYRFENNTAFMYGLPVNNQMVYVQVRAIGTDGSISNWVQVAAGVTVKPTNVTMKCKSLSGSKIPAGAIFAAVGQIERTLAFNTVNEIDF